MFVNVSLQQAIRLVKLFTLSATLLFYSDKIYKFTFQFSRGPDGERF